MRFADRVAVVTGGARGIGYAIVDRLSGEGASVLIIDREDAAGRATAEAFTRQGRAVTFFHGDVSDAAAVAGAFARADELHGRIDILVNCAALIMATPLRTATIEEVEGILAVNVGGVFLTAQALANYAIAKGTPAAVVNLSAIAAVQGSPALLAYSASKGAVSAMTRSLAVELADHEIRVNAIAPAAVSTENTLQLHADDPLFSERVLSRTPLRRLGRPEEIASVVAFLASDDASYITGQVVYPDGGRLALGYTVDPLASPTSH